MALNIRQLKFIEFYILYNENATKAAKMAGYSEKTAYTQGYELLKHPEVSEAIAKRRAKLQKRFEVTNESVTRELARIAFSRMSKHAKYDETGVRVLNSDDVDDDDMAAVNEVSQISTENGPNIKIKLHDKVKALELLSKKLGLFDGSGAKNKDSEAGNDLERVSELLNESPKTDPDSGEGTV